MNSSADCDKNVQDKSSLTAVYFDVRQFLKALHYRKIGRLSGYQMPGPKISQLKLQLNAARARCRAFSASSTSSRSAGALA
jgi:hypothetical protein